MGRRPDSTFGKRKIVIGMLSAGMINMPIATHFQGCECTISSLRTKVGQMGSAENLEPVQSEPNSNENSMLKTG